MPDRDPLLHQSARRGIDLFSGARGWEARAHATLGIDLLGIEHWEPAVKTSEAAGLRTLHRDVAVLDPEDFADEIGEDGILVGSPPCQSRSNAGKQLGAKDVGRVAQCMIDLADGKDTRAWHQTTCEDPRSLLTVEPLRWALALRPRVVLLEQVPPVLPDWKLVGSLLERVGYSWWAGILECERYGVPQTRERAVLIARRDGVPAHPPTPTHHRFVPNEPRPAPSGDLLGSMLSWVSMAEALGWGMTDRPGLTFAPGTGNGGAAYEDGSGARAALRRERDRGAWVVQTGNFTAVKRDDDAIRVTVPEAATLQSFPANWPWTGNKSQVYQQIGNAVPPLLGEAILRTVVPAAELRRAA